MKEDLPAPHDDGERLDRLRLIRSENIGPITFRQLLQRYGSAKAAITALPELAQRGGRRRGLKIASVDMAVDETAALAEIGGRQLHLGEPDYPAALAAIEDAPPVLSLLGHLHLLARHAVAVIGARNASVNGRVFVEKTARELGAAELVVVSGLARGIDTAAHRGAIETGTVAVMAGGVDVVYPRENDSLHDELRACGVILSEMPPGTKPQGRHFPRRNRIISGLSWGVVVIEAAERSGSLTTARFALEQGRDVFAVPGSPLDPRSGGTNRLIREGATLVRSAADVLEELNEMTPTRISEKRDTEFAPPREDTIDSDLLDDARPEILALLGPSPTEVDMLIRASGLPPALVWAVLLELEIAGRLARQPGNTVLLIGGGDSAVGK